MLTIQEQSTDRKVAKRLPNIEGLENMRGDAAVYELSPPFTATAWSGDADAEPTVHEFVTVSAIDDTYSDSVFSGPLRRSETMVFPSDGVTVTDWLELCAVNGKSHVRALAELGYEVSE